MSPRGHWFIVADLEDGTDNPIPFEDAIGFNEHMNALLRRAQRRFAKHERLRKQQP